MNLKLLCRFVLADSWATIYSRTCHSVSRCVQFCDARQQLSVRIIMPGEKNRKYFENLVGRDYQGRQLNRKSEIFAQVLTGDTGESYTFERSNVAKTWQSYKKILRESNFLNLLAVWCRNRLFLWFQSTELVKCPSLPYLTTSAYRR